MDIDMHGQGHLHACMDMDICMHACMHGCVRCVRSCVQAGRQAGMSVCESGERILMKKPRNGYTGLHLAIFECDIRQVMIAIVQPDVAGGVAAQDYYRVLTHSRTNRTR